MWSTSIAIPTVKVTGGQRIDLLGVRKEQLPEVWRDLNAAGMVSGHAYGKALRTVKTCVGSEWCRFGTQDSTAMGIALEKMTWGSWTPHKIKMAVSGCPRNCAEATIKDFGVIATEAGWDLHVGGNGGIKVRVTDLLAKVATEDEVLEYAAAFMQLYREEAWYLERTAPWVERVGIDYVRARLSDAGRPRGAARPLPGEPALRPGRSLGRARRGRRCARVPRPGDGGVTAMDGDHSVGVDAMSAAWTTSRGWARAWSTTPASDIAVFRTADDQVFALHDRCPHKAGKLSQGIVHGESVTCPLHNWVIGLADGQAQEPDEGCARTVPVRLDGRAHPAGGRRGRDAHRSIPPVPIAASAAAWSPQPDGTHRGRSGASGQSRPAVLQGRGAGRDAGRQRAADRCRWCDGAAVGLGRGAATWSPTRFARDHRASTGRTAWRSMSPASA